MKNEPDKKDISEENDRMTIQTGSSKYSFTKSWVENEGLKGILVGLVADDLNRQLSNDD